MPMPIRGADPARYDALWRHTRRIGGVCMVIAPALFLAAELLRIRFPYPVPQQLAAYRSHPAVMTASYSLSTVGLIALLPAFVTLAVLIGRTRPGWGVAGGAVATIGLLVNAFYEGWSHVAFTLVDALGPEAATRVVADTYASFSVMYPITFIDNLGWILLAVGAYLSRTLGWFRVLCLASMAAHVSGVLKGGTVAGIIEVVAMGVALVPLGVRVVRSPS